MDNAYEKLKNSYKCDIMEIIVNIVFTKGYDIPMTKELRRKNSSSLLPDIINVFLQMTACLVLSAFVLSAI